MTAKMRSLLSIQAGNSSNGLPLALTIGPKYSFSHTTTRTLGGKFRTIEANPFIVSSMAGPLVTTTCTTGCRSASGRRRGELAAFGTDLDGRKSRVLSPFCAMNSPWR
jgi:hypothetical protein